MPASENTLGEKGSHEPTFRYAAFISYRHVVPDSKWAKWLHLKLETYRIPKQLITASSPNRLGRVFRDEEELSASSDLSRAIDNALEQSRFLIVICSPHTPESKWVNQEIVRFRELGRNDQILALLIEGEPEDSFPVALREIRSEITAKSVFNSTEIEEIEPLAADVRFIAGESQRTVKRLAFLRIAATMLGKQFDDLRQRDQERKNRRLLQFSGLMLALLIGVGLLAFYAFHQKGAADHQRNIAEARMLVSQGELEFESEPLTGLLTAVEGLARIPDGEDELISSLTARVAIKAAKGRIMKVSDNTDKVYHQLPEFPYILLQNRHNPSTLFHVPNLNIVSKIDNLASKEPLRVTPSLEYFAVSRDETDPTYTLWNTVGRHSIGGTNTLSNMTLIPNQKPLYFLRDVGLSPLLKRLTGSTRIGREGFDIRKITYEPGAEAFALFYRDDENTRRKPPPDLLDLHQGAVVTTLPRTTDNIFFDTAGSPYYVVVIGDSLWQLRRMDTADQVIFEAEGSPNWVSFGKGVSADYLLVGFYDDTEIRRVSDGVLIDRIDDSLRAASPAAGGISWNVRMKSGSKLQVLSLVNDRLQLHAPAIVATEETTEPLFVPVASVAPLNNLLKDESDQHNSCFTENIYQVTKQDKKLRASVWRKGQNNQPVYFEDERPEDLEFLYIKRFYDDRPLTRENLIRSELRRNSDDSMVLGRHDAIRSYGADPSRSYIWMRVTDPEDEKVSEVVLIRFADGKIIWEGDGTRISFSPDLPTDYFFVWTGSGQDQLRKFSDGEEIVSLTGALRNLDFQTLTEEGYFIAAFKDGQYELWNGNNSPASLLKLGFGLRGYLRLPNGFLMIWYENGNAYVIDPTWLASIGGDPGRLPRAELLDALCDGLFNKSWFHRQAWNSLKQIENRACIY